MRPIFIRACFRHALKKPAPQTIPRSGEEGAKVDCYAVKIQIDKDQSFWIERILWDILSGYIYDQRSEQKEYHTDASFYTRYFHDRNYKI